MASKNKGTSSGVKDLSSKFTTGRSGVYGRHFIWEIPNFRDVNTKCVFGNYFDLGVFRLRFVLYPRGHASSKNRHLSFQLEADKNHFNTPLKSCFVSSKITLVNHVDESNSLHTPIFYRLSPETSSVCLLDYTEFESLHERGFLLNGDELRITGTIFYFDEMLSFQMRKLPSEVQEAGPSVVVPAVLKRNAILQDHTYEGEVIWKIQNNSCLDEIMREGSMKSPRFEIGECRYSMFVGTPSEMDDNDQLYMKMSVEPLLKIDGDFKFGLSGINAWFISNFTMKTSNGSMTKNVSELLGRWVKVASLSEFSSLQKQRKGSIKFTLRFYGFTDKDRVCRNKTSGRNIWKFGEGPSSKGKLQAPNKEYAHYSWQIWNFMSIDKIRERSTTAETRIDEMRGRRIRLDRYDFNLVISPWGDAEHPNELGVYLSSTPVTDGDELNMLVHFRISAVNQIDPKQSITRERICRFGVSGKPLGFSKFMPMSRFRKKTGGFIVLGKCEFEAHIHVLEEAYDDKNVDVACGTEILRVRWRVDNFLAWDKIEGAKGIPSKYMIVNGCGLRIAFYVASDGCVYGTLSHPEAVEGDAIYFVSFTIGLMKQKNRGDGSSSDFQARVDGVTNKMSVGKVGLLSEILKRGDYILNDKALFFCNFYTCNRIEAISMTSTEITNQHQPSSSSSSS